MAAEYPEARVLIIVTGGTMCVRRSPEGFVVAGDFLAKAMAPLPCFNDGSKMAHLPVMTDKTHQKYLPSYRTPPSTYSRHVRYTAYEYEELLDSTSISSAAWTQIARTVHDNYSLYDGFVIVHGTDSLAYTSSALSFMLQELGKPVILTGSQAPIYELQTDAIGNLLGSLILAGTFMIPEVGLFFHNRLFRGNRALKTSTSSFDAFASPNCPPLARFQSLGAEVDWALIRRPTTIGRFSIQTVLDTAYVACLRVFPGIRPAMLDAVLRITDLRGLILETFGAGNAPETTGPDGSLFDIVRAAIARGVIIVNVSQCPSGAVAPVYAIGSALGRAGVVWGEDLTTEAALTKLSYLLAQSDPALSSAEIAAQMGRSIRGEMTARPLEPSFSHPAYLLSPLAMTSGTGLPVSATVARQHARETAFKTLMRAIRTRRVDEVVVLLDNEVLGLLDMRDAAGNSVLHLACMKEGNWRASKIGERGASAEDIDGLEVNEKEESVHQTRPDPSCSTDSSDPSPRVRVVQEILGRGASVHVRNMAGETPLGVALRRRRRRSGLDREDVGQVDGRRQIAKEEGGDERGDEDRRNVAIDLEIARVLVEAGALLHPDEDGGPVEERLWAGGLRR